MPPLSARMAMCWKLKKTFFSLDIIYEIIFHAFCFSVFTFRPTLLNFAVKYFRQLIKDIPALFSFLLPFPHFPLTPLYFRTPQVVQAAKINKIFEMYM
jgi:hypothetical protein